MRNASWGSWSTTPAPSTRAPDGPLPLPLPLPFRVFPAVS